MLILVLLLCILVLLLLLLGGEWVAHEIASTQASTKVVRREVRSKEVLLLVCVDRLGKGRRSRRIDTCVRSIEPVLIIEGQVQPQAIAVLVHFDNTGRNDRPPLFCVLIMVCCQIAGRARKGGFMPPKGGKHEPNTPFDRQTQNVEREVLPPELYRDDRPGMIQELIMSDRRLCEWRGSGELNVLGEVERCLPWLAPKWELT